MSSLINLKFSPEMEEAVIIGKKCCTTRREQKGDVGDLFIVRDRMYRIVGIEDDDLDYIATWHQLEGFETPEGFIDTLLEFYPTIVTGDMLYVHWFAYVTDICPDFNQGHNCCIPSVCPASEVCKYE